MVINENHVEYVVSFVTRLSGDAKSSADTDW